MPAVGKRWVLLGGLLGAAAGAWLVTHPDGPGAAADPGAPPPTELIAPGSVEGSTAVLELRFATAGRVAEVLVEEGQRIAAGQLLARLDASVLRARVAQAEAALAVATARRDATVRGPRRAELRAARAEADAAGAAERTSYSARRRAERLYAQEAISAQEIERVRGGANADRARAQAARARLALVREGSAFDQLREAEAVVEAARADLDAGRALLAETELRAPRAGVILRRLIEPGVTVVLVPPTLALTMSNLDQMYVRTEIDEGDLARLRPGQRGYATAEAFAGRRFPGQVSRISPVLGRKSIPIDDPRARLDVRVLEVMFALDETPRLPLGLRMVVHLPSSATLPTGADLPVRQP